MSLQNLPILVRYDFFQIHSRFLVHAKLTEVSDGTSVLSDRKNEYSYKFLKVIIFHSVFLLIQKYFRP
jgi:hypothetical protein